MPYITSQNTAITAERNWLISKQYQDQWPSAERMRLRNIAKRYKVRWSGNIRRIPRNILLECMDIIPTGMVTIMVIAENDWGVSKLTRNSDNLFGMKCMGGRCTNAPGGVRGYLQFSSVKESVSAYTTNLNTHPAYSLFRRSRAQLRKTNQEVTVTTVIYELKDYSTRGKSHDGYLLAMYQDNQWLVAVYT